MRAVIYILSIICVTLLLINFNLIGQLNESKERELDLEFKYKTSQNLYELTRDEVLRLENENQLLGSMIAHQEIINP